MKSLFHLAFNVTDLDEARRFYGGVLGCAEGRASETWVDFDFFGHQLSLHLGTPFATAPTGQVDGQLVPMPHFGLVLALPDWQAMAGRLKAAQTDFVLAPQVRFEGRAGRAVDDVLPRPVRQPAGDEGLSRARNPLRRLRRARLQPSGAMRCSMAPNTDAPPLPRASMRSVSPNFRKPVAARPVSAVSSARFSRMLL